MSKCQKCGYDDHDTGDMAHYCHSTPIRERMNIPMTANPYPPVNHTQPSQQVPVAIENERAAFEEWFAEWSMDAKPEWTPERNCYEDFATHCAWKAWNARALLDQSAPDAGLAEDAKRYHMLRQHVAPAYLSKQLRINVADVSPSETIAEHIDKMVDAALASQEPQHG